MRPETPPGAPSGAPETGHRELPRFTNVAADAGLAATSARRAVFGDLDGDGWPDLVLDAARAWHSVAGPDGARRFEPRPDSGLDRGLAGSLRHPDLVLLADLDGDGDLDAVSGRMVDLERPLVLPGSEQPVIDPDGCPVPAIDDHGERSEVLRNDGRGRFTAVPGSGLGRPETTAALAAFDHDGDGALDLFVGNWYREYGVSYRAYSDRLYRGRGDGRFDDATAMVGIETDDSVGECRSARPTYGATHADVNGDGLMDILVASYGRQANVLWLGQEDGTFRDAAAEWGFDGDSRRDGDYWVVERPREPEWRANGNTFDLAVADADGDGGLDVLTGEICHYWGGPSSDRSELLLNRGGARFERVRDRGLDRVHPEPWKWNEGDIHVAFLDFDNDGREDALVSSSDYPDPQYLRLWRQVDRGRFREVTAEVGLDWEGSGGISIADYDRDGDLDIVAGRSLSRLPAQRAKTLGVAPALWRNDGGNRNRWLDVVLRGRRSNRMGVGARVVVRAGGRSWTRELITGRGHMGHEDELRLHFGLGTLETVDEIEVRWPGPAARRERFGPFASGGTVVLEEDGGRR